MYSFFICHEEFRYSKDWIFPIFSCTKLLPIWLVLERDGKPWTNWSLVLSDIWFLPSYKIDFKVDSKMILFCWENEWNLTNILHRTGPVFLEDQCLGWVWTFEFLADRQKLSENIYLDSKLITNESKYNLNKTLTCKWSYEIHKSLWTLPLWETWNSIPFQGAKV